MSALPSGIATENAAFARKVFGAARRLCHASPEIVIQRNRRLKKNATYMVKLDVAGLMRELGVGMGMGEAAGATVAVPVDVAAAETGAEGGTGGAFGADAGDGAGIASGAVGDGAVENSARAGDGAAECGARADAGDGAPQGAPGAARPDAHLLKRLSKKKCCKKAALRGAFLAGGSISDPEKLYHLEIFCKKPDMAAFLAEAMSAFGLAAKIIDRSEYHIVYLKESDSIVNFLNVTGAHRALMSLENIRIVKDMRNSVNRIVNCETANLEKTVAASVRQVDSILCIRENAGFDELPDGLREIAELRMANRESGLEELGQCLSPPLGKSGVNHRLRKLDSIARELRAGRGRGGAAGANSGRDS
jgi:DNA-binding transcriptional regulator WhiA